MSLNRRTKGARWRNVKYDLQYFKELAIGGECLSSEYLDIKKRFAFKCVRLDSLDKIEQRKGHLCHIYTPIMGEYPYIWAKCVKLHTSQT